MRKNSPIVYTVNDTKLLQSESMYNTKLGCQPVYLFFSMSVRPFYTCTSITRRDEHNKIFSSTLPCLCPFSFPVFVPNNFTPHVQTIFPHSATHNPIKPHYSHATAHHSTPNHSTNQHLILNHITPYSTTHYSILKHITQTLTPLTPLLATLSSLYRPSPNSKPHRPCLNTPDRHTKLDLTPPLPFPPGHILPLLKPPLAPPKLTWPAHYWGIPTSQIMRANAGLRASSLRPKHS